MSNKAMAWAWDCEIDDALCKFILVKLADLADDNFECFPSYGYLAKQCAIHRRTVIRKVIELQDVLGLLVIKPRERRNGSESSNSFKLKPSDAELKHYKTITSERQKPKTEALKTALDAAKDSDTQTLPSDTQTLGEVVTHEHSPSDTQALPSDTGVTPPSDTGVTPLTIINNPLVNLPVDPTTKSGGGMLTPSQLMEPVDGERIAKIIINQWQSMGAFNKQGCASRIQKVIDDGELDQLLLGIQNYVNANQRKDFKWPRLENLIAKGDWRGYTTVVPGSFHVPGAPPPPRALSEAEKISKRVTENYQAKQKTLEHQL